MAALVDATGIGAVLTQGSGASLALCSAGCAMPASWMTGDLDTQATLNAGLPDPYTVSPGCEVNGMPVRPQLATWASEAPAAAVSSRGLVVQTGTRRLRTCPGVSTPTLFPGYGRLLFVP